MKMFISILFVISLINSHSACAQVKDSRKVKKLQHNVVFLESGYGTGWGFIIGKKDNTLYIVTANHVVRGQHDGGPDDKATVKVRFFTDQGTPYDAVLQDNWISSKAQDLAVVTASEPPRFKYQRANFGCIKDDIHNLSIWFIGKDGQWFIPKTPGQVDDVYNDKFSVSGLRDAAAGSSGAPLISSKGFEGLLLGPAPDGISIEAVSLKYTRSRLKAWNYPFADSELKKSTYFLGAFSVGLIAGGISYANKKNDTYAVYKQNRDETAPVYNDKSRDEYFQDAKTFQTKQNLSFILAGACALTAYLVNKDCLFHRTARRDAISETSILQKIGWSYDAYNKSSSISIRLRF